MREYVRERKEALQLSRRATFVPQCYAPGQEAQVDWYEACVDFGPGSFGMAPEEGNPARAKVYVFAMRAMHSGAAFHMAFPHATQQAFLEAHEAAFAYFGGVFHQLRYDNLGSAVKKILRGYQREETERFTAFRSHWGFASEFCNPARGNEKGGVEGEVGYYRRNHLVPVPVVPDWMALNQLLLGACVADGGRRIGDRAGCVDALWSEERTCLLPLAAEPFDLGEVLWAKVDAKGCVRAKTNYYSTPLRPGTQAKIVVSAVRAEVWQDNRRVAVHDRCYQRNQRILELDHYLDVLWRKPGALAGSMPLAQARAQGRWPECFDTLWQRLQERHGRMKGTQHLVELLLFASGQNSGGQNCGGRFPVVAKSGKSQPGASRPGTSGSFDRLRIAVERALQMGTVDVEAIRLLLAQGDEDAAALTLIPGSRPPGTAPLQNQDLTPVQRSLYERPLPDMRCYDRLRPSDTSPAILPPSTLAPALRLVSGSGQEEVA